MNYVGIDYHKRYSVVTAVDEKGHVLRTTRLDSLFKHSSAALMVRVKLFLKQLGRGACCTISLRAKRLRK
jgi:hypothetical protein